MDGPAVSVLSDVIHNSFCLWFVKCFEEEKRKRFFEGCVLWSWDGMRGIQASKRRCKATADFIQHTMPFMPPLRECNLVFCISALDQVLINFTTKLLTVSPCAPEPGVWGCGGAWRGTRRARTTGLWPPPLSPARDKGGHRPCKHFLFV